LPFVIEVIKAINNIQQGATKEFAGGGDTIHRKKKEKKGKRRE